MDLAGQMLEEAVELIQVPVGGRQEGRRDRPPSASAHARDLDHLQHELVSEALDPAAKPDQIAALEAARQDVGVPERARLHVPVRSRSSSARYGEPVRVISRSLRTHANTPSTSLAGAQRG